MSDKTEFEEATELDFEAMAKEQFEKRAKAHEREQQRDAKEDQEFAETIKSVVTQKLGVSPANR